MKCEYMFTTHEKKGICDGEEMERREGGEMNKFKKLVAIEPVFLQENSRKEIRQYCEEAVFYDEEAADADDIVRRIGDADGIFVSFKHPIGKEILEKCPNLKYIGMCCSLYSEKSSNVDIAYAREHGITVTGVRDYGDEGVAEYVVSELIQILHGTGGYTPFLGIESEIKDLKVGILGMGATAQVIANALKFFGANISYYSRTRKKDLENENGYQYRELDELLKTSDVVCSCLSKNVTLLYERELELLGEQKILFNTSLSPSFDMDAMKTWLSKKDTHYFCDTLMGLGEEELLTYSNVHCIKKSSGTTKQAIVRLNEKVLRNLREYVQG